MARYVIEGEAAPAAQTPRYIVTGPAEVTMPETPITPGPEAPGFLDIAGEEAGSAMETLTTAPAMGAVTTPLAVLQLLGLPVTAGARKLGYETLEHTGSPVAAGVVDATGQVLGGAAMGKAAQMGRGLLQRGAARLPGAGAALREEATDELGRAVGKLKPATPSDQLYAIARQANPPIDQLPKFQAQVDDLLRSEGMLGEFGQAEKAFVQELSAIKARLASGQPVPFEQVDLLRQSLGESLGELRRQGGKKLGAYKKLYASLSEDLETSANAGVGPAFEALKQANRAAKQEFGLDELQEIVAKNLKTKEGTDLKPSVAFAKVKDQIQAKLRDDKLFAQSLPKAEVEKIISFLDEARKLPLPPPPRTAPVGSSLVNARAIKGGGLGGAIGSYFGGPAGGAVGGALGAAGGVAFSEIISRAITSEKGRQVLLGFLRRPGALSPARMSAMSAAVRAVTEPQREAPE